MQQQQSPRDALVAARFDPTEQRKRTTDELTALAETAGYTVVAKLTQTRAEDSAYQFGRGKAEELARRVAEIEVDSVLIDNPLSPQQAHNLRTLAPDDVRFVDRHQLVLDIFAERAGTKEAKLQVKLAELRYGLPRVRQEIRLEREAANERRTVAGMNEKEHRRVLDIRERIKRVEQRLDSFDSVGADRRARYRDAGRDLVALAGYTNAGKSTLLRRLADELDVSDGHTAHPDEPTTAATADRLFETLDTTTRRVSTEGRQLLVTDTVGFVRDLPPWLVDAFESTLSAAYHADVVLLVVDASDSLSEVRAKVESCRDVLEGRTSGTILPVVNKVDQCSTAHVEDVREVVGALAGADPVAVSATEGRGVDELLARIRSAVPTATATFEVPNTGETQTLLSWAYDHGTVEAVDYEGESVRFTLVGRPPVVEKMRARTSESSGRR